MRPADRVLGATLLAGMLFAATFIDAAWQRSAHEPALQRTAELVTRLRLRFRHSCWRR